MPLDDALPVPGLPGQPSRDQVVAYFRDTYAIRVDVERLDTLPELERVPLTGARTPEPPEAVLIDGVLQLVPARLLVGVERIVMLSRGTARFGGYRNGIIRLGVGSAERRVSDDEFGGSFSVFSITVLHEVSHSVYATVLTASQRIRLDDLYLSRLLELRVVPPSEPSAAGAEHYFVRLLTAALLGTSAIGGVTTRFARERLEAIGLSLPHTGDQD